MIGAEVFDIQHYCVDDGPGIRTNLFLAGCPLNCAWCHNPEGKYASAQLLFYRNKCTRCGRCAQVCPNGSHRWSNSEHLVRADLCDKCGKCVDVCPNGALKLSSRFMTVDEIEQELMLDEPFYRSSGGGITLSGGEPLLHPQLIEELAQRLHRRGIHVTAETSGYIAPEMFARLEPYIDLYLFDIKLTDAQEHYRYTGVYPDRILSNLNLLAARRKPVVLRCPIIPGVNDRQEHIRAVAGLADVYENVQYIELIPYHSLGLSKYEALSTNPGYERQESMPRQEAERLAGLVQAYCGKEIRVC